MAAPPRICKRSSIDPVDFVMLHEFGNDSYHATSPINDRPEHVKKSCPHVVTSFKADRMRAE
jgi:hypothetical protein